MANYFIIGGDGRQYGPTTDADVAQWLEEGRLGPQTKVQLEGTSEWKLLSEFPEFSAATKTTPPPLPAGTSSSTAKTSGLAITSLVLGILGIFTCGVTALIGLILGIIALVKISNSQGRLRGRGLALSGTILSGMFMLLIPVFAAMLLPALAAAKNKAQEISCLNNEKQMALAVVMYADSHTNRFPSAASWCDDIKSLVVAESAFRCPGANASGACGYAFNAKLDGMGTDKVNPLTVLIFESDGGWNAHGGQEMLPANARHHGRGSKAECMVAFTDGHVEVVPKARLNSLRWDP